MLRRFLGPTLLIALLATAALAGGQTTTPPPPPLTVTVTAPPTSVGDLELLLRFSSPTPGAAVTVTLDDSTTPTLVTSAPSTGMVQVLTLPNLTPGVHRWRVAVVNAVVTPNEGAVFVDGQVRAIATKLDGLEKDMDLLEARLAPEALKDLSENVTVVGAAIDGLRKEIAGLENLTIGLKGSVASLEVETRSGIEGQRAAVASSVGNVPLQIGALLFVALALVGGGLIVDQRRRHKETMVMVLALAARVGVTPETDEFRRAVAAIDGKWR